MIVDFGRGHDDARACPPDFAPERGIKICEPNLATRHQTNSESSALPNSPITSSSSPACAIILAASAQPLRTGLAGLRSTRAPSSIVISTPAVASRPSWASTGFGITTPWEFPIRQMFTFRARMIPGIFLCQAEGTRRSLTNDPEEFPCSRHPLLTLTSCQLEAN